MRQKIRFIINPLAGGKSKSSIPAMVESIIDKNIFEFEACFTNSEQNTLDLAKQSVDEGLHMVVAVGGDGTINNIAQFLVGTQTALAILPMGSGNGLARELKIPMQVDKGLHLINKNKSRLIDTGKINGRFFGNLAGVGFDAHVGNLFATSKTRGLITYTKITLSEFINFKPETYKIIVDGIEVEHTAFMAVVANGAQFGNNAFIAPAAIPDDGRFNITVVEPFNNFMVPAIGLKMFLKRIDDFAFVKTYTGKSIIIKRVAENVVNIDGEPVKMEADLTISIQPKSLKVIVP